MAGFDKVVYLAPLACLLSAEGATRSAPDTLLLFALESLHAAVCLGVRLLRSCSGPHDRPT